MSVQADHVRPYPGHSGACEGSAPLSLLGLGSLAHSATGGDTSSGLCRTNIGVRGYSGAATEVLEGPLRPMVCRELRRYGVRCLWSGPVLRRFEPSPLTILSSTRNINYDPGRNGPNGSLRTCMGGSSASTTSAHPPVAAL